MVSGWAGEEKDDGMFGLLSSDETTCKGGLKQSLSLFYCFAKEWAGRGPKIFFFFFFLAAVHFCRAQLNNRPNIPSYLLYKNI